VKPFALLAALILAGAATIAHAQEAPPRPDPVAQDERATTPVAFFNEPNILDKAIRYGSQFASSGDGGETKNGFYPEFGDMITGAGWISGGPGYRHWLFGDRLFVDASAALSWRMYKMTQARVELPKLARSRITAGAQLRWQDLTQVTYFGAGPDSLETDRSEYRMESANIVGYVTGKPTQWLSIKGKVGWITRPSIHAPGGTFERGYPDTRTVFPDDPVYQLTEQPNFLHGEVGVVADTRDHRGYPSEGGVYQASWSQYADREIDRFSFHRFEAEAAHFFPVASDRIVLIAHGWFAGSRADEGQEVPFYLQPTLGGASSLRSYTSYRFHDNNLVLVNAEARVRIFEHVDWAVFADAGNVAPKAGDLDFARRSYGIGFRVHTRQATVARMDVAHGDEGWQVLFRVNDPFRFSRVSRRTAPVPFVP
jgi:hypothetical protein